MLHLAESRGHFWRPVLPQIDANIGVEHIAGAHQRRFRRCGCGSLRFFGNMSAGNSARKSRTRTIPAAFSRNTIFVAAPENLNFRAFDSELLRQPHSLAVPGLNTRALVCASAMLPN